MKLSLSRIRKMTTRGVSAEVFASWTSYVKHRFLWQCLRKRKFDTREEAAGKAAEFPAVDGRAAAAYECPFCRGWHVGRKPK